MFFQKKVLTFEWKSEENLSWMEANLSEDEELLPNLIPPLCINTKFADVKEVETSYNPATIKFLFDAPKFPSDAVHNIVQNVLENIPDVDFPLPKAFEIIDIKNHINHY